MCLLSMKNYFIIWSRTPTTPDGACKSFHRELPPDIRQRGEFNSI
jgi:hypothetical protein